MVSSTPRGGAGNCLFCIAATIAYSLKNNMPYCIPMEVQNPHYEGQKPYIFDGVKYCDKTPDLPIYKEPYFHYAKIPYQENILLDGYWQSWRFFDAYREEILKAFGFKYKRNERVSIHKRIGDYKKFPQHHPIVSDEYIEQAILHFASLGYKKFLVFSDTIEELKELLSQPRFNLFDFEFSEGKSEIEDLEAMSSCQHNIICNSTFSWWAQYLNQNTNKIIVAPQKDKWFGEEMKHNVDDLYMNNWTLI